ncbi:hypothetical protein lerEdw1_016833 [Lerista edwardsae]|nr:hypothetical protein lerEdw1_016833 [Lerista edwardsae]
MDSSMAQGTKATATEKPPVAGKTSQFSTKVNIFNSLAKVKIDVVAKLLWDASKDQIFIIEASRIIINDIQIREQKSMTDPSEKDMQSVLGTILIDVVSWPIDYHYKISCYLIQGIMNHYIRLVADILNASLLSTLASAVPIGTVGTIKYRLIGSPKQKPLMTTDLTGVIPKISGYFPTPQPLVVEIRGSNFPLVSMDSPGIMVKQYLFTEVLTHGKSVLHLEVSMVFKAKCSASNNKLFISLSQSSFDVVRTSSLVGSNNAQKLHEWINNIYLNSFLPSMNGWPSDFNVAMQLAVRLVEHHIVGSTTLEEVIHVY